MLNRSYKSTLFASLNAAIRNCQSTVAAACAARLGLRNVKKGESPLEPFDSEGDFSRASQSTTTIVTALSFWKGLSW